MTSSPTTPSKSSEQEHPVAGRPEAERPEAERPEADRSVAGESVDGRPGAEGPVAGDLKHGAPNDQPLIHPLSALLLIVIDALWTLPDMAAFAWIVTIPACFLAVFLPTFFIQKFMKKDKAGKAIGVAAALGVLAAVPTPIMGTAVGAIALGLSGLRSLGGKR